MSVRSLFLWILCAVFTGIAQNFYIAATPLVLKGVTKEQSAFITDEFIKKYNETARYKLMSREKMKSMLSKQLLDRSDDFSETSYNLAIARLLSVQYLLCGTVEKNKSGNTFILEVFDFKAQTNLKKFSESGKESPEKLASKMTLSIVSVIDDILSNDRVVLSMIEAEKNAAQVAKPVVPVAVKQPADEKVTRKKWSFLKKIKSEKDDSLKSANATAEKTSAVITPVPSKPKTATDFQQQLAAEEKQKQRDSMSLVMAEKKRLEYEEKSRREQAFAIAETEKKRLKAEKEFEANNKNKPAAESAEKPFRVKKVEADLSINKEPSIVQDKTNEGVKTATVITPAPSAIVSAPEPDQTINTEEKPSKRDSIAQAREEKKRLKEEEKFKRKQAAILAETEKKRVLAEKEFALNKNKITGMESTQEPVPVKAKTVASPVKTEPPNRNKPARPESTVKKPELPTENKPETQDKVEAASLNTIPAAKTPTPAVTIRPANKPAPDAVSPKQGKKISRSEAAAMARAERKKEQAAQKVKRTEAAAMAKAGKGRSPNETIQQKQNSPATIEQSKPDKTVTMTTPKKAEPAEKNAPVVKKESAIPATADTAADKKKKRRTTVITSIFAGAGIVASVPIIMYLGSKDEEETPANESFFLDIIW